MAVNLLYRDEPEPLRPLSAVTLAPFDWRAKRPQLPIVCPPGKVLRISRSKRGINIIMVDAPAPAPQPEPQPDGSVLHVDPATGDYSPPPYGTHP